MVHMIPERDTDSVAPTPTPQQHPRYSQHHHLSLHELRALQVHKNISTYDKSRKALKIPRIYVCLISNISLIFYYYNKHFFSYALYARVKKIKFLQRRPECTGNSSSDENRSSGHASMSDTGGHTSSSSPPHRHHKTHSPQQLNAVPEDDRLSASVTQRNGKRSGQNRNRHRATPAKVSIKLFL